MRKSACVYPQCSGKWGRIKSKCAPDGSIDGVEVISGGTGYGQGDMLLISSPIRYQVGAELNVRAKINDPLGEVKGLTFLANGTEIEGSVEAYGNERVMTFIPTSQQPGFISARLFLEMQETLHRGYYPMVL